MAGLPLIPTRSREAASLISAPDAKALFLLLHDILDVMADGAPHVVVRREVSPRFFLDETNSLDPVTVSLLADDEDFEVKAAAPVSLDNKAAWQYVIGQRDSTLPLSRLIRLMRANEVGTPASLESTFRRLVDRDLVVMTGGKIHLTEKGAADVLKIVAALGSVPLNPQRDLVSAVDRVEKAERTAADVLGLTASWIDELASG